MSSIDQEVADRPRSWQLAAEVADEYARWLPPHGARVAAVGCGTSYYIAGAYAALRESLGHGETDAFPASEFPLTRSYDAILLITRSGTTTEVFLFPLVLTSNLSAQPVTVVVAALNGQRIVPMTLLMACGVIAAAIPGIIALVLNRFVVEGVAAGSSR